MYKTPSKKEVLERLAFLEVSLARLETDFSLCEHKNVLVAEGIVSADKLLKAAIKRLSFGDTEHSWNLCGVAWLHINFGQQLMVAELLESTIGESDFLELVDNKLTSSDSPESHFARGEQIILNFLAQTQEK